MASWFCEQNDVHGVDLGGESGEVGRAVAQPHEVFRADRAAPWPMVRAKACVAYRS